MSPVPMRWLVTSCTEVTERSSVLFTCTEDPDETLHDYDVANLARNVGFFTTLYIVLRSTLFHLGLSDAARW